MKMRIIYIVLALAAITSCGGNPKQQKKASQSAQKVVAMEIPNPPAMMTDIEERSEYMMEHFWQSYKPEVDSLSLEQAFANWCTLATVVRHDLSTKSLLQIYDLAPERILPLAERYLYDVNSPYRDEDLYGALAAHVGTPEYAMIASMCALNAVGTPATDFVYEDSRGRRHRLYEIEAPYTIVFFSNPGCHACQGIIETIGSSYKLVGAIDAGTVAVVNMYIDEDLDAWREYLPNYPGNWHTGFDPLYVLRDGDSYHIRAIPSVYLLDSKKNVILKDAPTERLIQYLETSL